MRMKAHPVVGKGWLSVPRCFCLMSLFTNSLHRTGEHPCLARAAEPAPSRASVVTSGQQPGPRGCFFSFSGTRGLNKPRTVLQMTQRAGNSAHVSAKTSMVSRR